MLLSKLSLLLLLLLILLLLVLLKIFLFNFLIIFLLKLSGWNNLYTYTKLDYNFLISSLSFVVFLESTYIGGDIFASITLGTV